MRMTELPPAPELSVIGLEIKGKELTVQLHAKDEQYRFRGFRPIFFALAGEKRSVVSKSPTEVTMREADGDVKLQVPARDEAHLELRFSTPRAGEELKLLEDLYLWYKNVRVFKLDMSAAVVLPEAEAAPNADGV